MRTTREPRRRRLGLVSAALVGAVLWLPAVGSSTEPQNIIMIMADDLDWTDLPFFNPPVEWDDPSNPPDVATNADAAEAGAHPSRAEAGTRLPGLNRLAARLFADQVGTSNVWTFGTFEDTSDPYTVVPIDLVTTTTYEHSKCNEVRMVSGTTMPGLPDGCSAETDILSTAGGLRWLAGGAVFKRFYSSSAVCSPARASFMTGRHPRRIGVPQQSTPLTGDEITIAEFLKQGCQEHTVSTDRLCIDDHDSETPKLEACDCYLTGSCDDAICYTTGAVGKWHMGANRHRDETPWQQGLDEFIGIRGGWRDPFRRGDLMCGPNTWGKCCEEDNPDNCETEEEEYLRCSNDEMCDGADAPYNSCEIDVSSKGKRRTGLYIGDEKAEVNACVFTPSNQEAVTNTDCCEPIGKKPRGRYKFRKKDAFENVKITRDNNKVWKCNKDGLVKDTKCIYHTRWIRDHAVAFIKRHKDAYLDPPQGGEKRPFFLFVSFTATHFPHNAPSRTIEHYDAIKEMRPKTPKGRARYWAMLEELDAAVGMIVAEVKKDSALVDNTLILFTSDHGRPGSLYGNPQLRGGKSNVREGGLRVGLLVRGGETLFPDGMEGVLGDDTLGSFVDLFPTIAQAAGYDDGTNYVNAFESGAGEDTRRLKPLSGGKEIPGISLLPTLASGSSSADRRNMIFAQYKNDTSSVVTRQGFFKDRKCSDPNDCDYAHSVCGFEAEVKGGHCDGGPDDGEPCAMYAYKTVEKDSCASGGNGCRGKCSNNGDPCDEETEETDCTGGATCEFRVARHVRAASCIPCVDASQDCPAEEAEGTSFCYVLGGVCVTEDEEDRCNLNFDPDDADSRCPVELLPRCSKNRDCPDGTKCIHNAAVPCDTGQCFTASWKLRGSTDGSGTTLYDLVTNPEENDKDFREYGSDFNGNGPLNCYDSTCDRGSLTGEPICWVQEYMECVRDDWFACVVADDPDCEAEGESPEGRLIGLDPSENDDCPDPP